MTERIKEKVQELGHAGKEKVEQAYEKVREFVGTAKAEAGVDLAKVRFQDQIEIEGGCAFALLTIVWAKEVITAKCWPSKTLTTRAHQWPCIS